MDDIFSTLLAVFLIALAVGIFVFWVKMLVRAATLPSGSEKIAWVLIVLFAGVIGAVIFSFAGPKPDKRGIDGMTDEERRELDDMRREFEQNAERRQRIVLTPEEERLIEQYRQSYQGKA